MVLVNHTITILNLVPPSPVTLVVFLFDYADLFLRLTSETRIISRWNARYVTGALFERGVEFPNSR